MREVAMGKGWPGLEEEVLMRQVGLRDGQKAGTTRAVAEEIAGLV